MPRLRIAQPSSIKRTSTSVTRAASSKKHTITSARSSPSKSSKRYSFGKRRVVLITGMSGAGLSTALKLFEDLGYESVDNLRLNLVSALVGDVPESRSDALAVAIDTRNANFSTDHLGALVDDLRARTNLDVSLVFLECDDEVLQQRFSETRRRHPLALDRPVTDGIHAERTLLMPLREAADLVLDTSRFSIHDLRRTLAGHWRLETDVGLTIFVTSFSYKRGVPREADLVFDVRFLTNPHWDPILRPLCGLDEAVATFIRRDADYTTFMSHLNNLVIPLLPRFVAEGRSYLTIALGCSGGRHRSVFVAEELAATLAAQGYIIGLGHRDLDRMFSGQPTRSVDR